MGVEEAGDTEILVEFLPMHVKIVEKLIFSAILLTREPSIEGKYQILTLTACF